MQICWIGTDLSDLAASTRPFPTSPHPHPTHFWRHQSVLFQSSQLPSCPKQLLILPITEEVEAGGREAQRGPRAGRFEARRPGRRLCYASGLFNRVVICWCCCRSCLRRLVNGKLPSLWKGERSTKLKYSKEKNIELFLFLFSFPFLTEKEMQICRLISNAQRGGISTSLHGGNKRKSKSFQRGHFHAKRLCFN